MQANPTTTYELEILRYSFILFMQSDHKKIPCLLVCLYERESNLSDLTTASTAVHHAFRIVFAKKTEETFLILNLFCGFYSIPKIFVK